MRILVIAPGWPSLANPAKGIFVQEQVRALARQHQVIVLAQESGTWRERLREPLRFAVEHFLDDGVPVYRTRSTLPPQRPGALVRRVTQRRSSSGFRALVCANLRRLGDLADRVLDRAVAEHGPPDVIHAHFALPSGWTGVRLSRRAGVPLVITEHQAPSPAYIGDRLQRRLVRESLNAAGIVLCAGPALAEWMRGFHADLRPRVVGNIVDTGFFAFVPQRQRAADELRLATVALLTPDKGVADLIDAVALLIARGRSVRLEVVGDGPARAALERLAAQRGVANRCTFRGILARGGVRDALAACDVFVLASLHETFGVAVAEAIAAGRPVVATRCGGPEYFVGPEAGLLVQPGRPEELAEAIEAIASGEHATDPSRARAALDARFGPAAYLEQLESAYRDARTGGKS
ncbi:MAG: glycosyltransferase [Acidobacteria bacterium]|nr:glycosyltransferase [Acidobacteriota bacterium]